MSPSGPVARRSDKDRARTSPAELRGRSLIARGDALGQVWLVLLLPLVGAALAAVVHKVLYSGRVVLPDDGSASAIAARPDNPA